MGKLTGSVVFITGASAGIGAALARRCVREGARVALVARRIERLAALAAELGESALALQADVTVDGELERAAEQAREAFGAIDVVVANAGFGVVGPVRKLALEDFRRQFETNVFGVLRTIAATREAVERARGVFVLIGSVAGYLPAPNLAAYNMSKAAVHSLAHTLRGEMVAKGVGVVLIVPGFVESEIRKVDNAGALRPEAPDVAPTWLRMPAEKAAAEIVDAIVHRERERVLTLHGAVATMAHRHAPGLVAGVIATGARLRARRAT